MPLTLTCPVVDTQEASNFFGDLRENAAKTIPVPVSPSESLALFRMSVQMAPQNVLRNETESGVLSWRTPGLAWPGECGRREPGRGPGLTPGARRPLEPTHCPWRLQENHYQPLDQDACLPCDCFPDGSRSRACDMDTGQCACKPGVIGRQCNRCDNPFAEVTVLGCEGLRCPLTPVRPCRGHRLLGMRAGVSGSGTRSAAAGSGCVHLASRNLAHHQSRVTPTRPHCRVGGPRGPFCRGQRALHLRHS